MQELFDRFERGRAEYTEHALAGIVTSADWRPVAAATWRALVRLRVETPGGVALRRAVDATPRLRDLDRGWVDRSARGFAGAIRARRPEVGEAEAYRAAWAASLVVSTLLDDVCVSGEIDEAKFEMAVQLMLTWFAPYLDPA